MVRRQIPSPAIACANASGSSRRSAVVVPAGRLPRSRRGRGTPGPLASASRPANARSPCGTSTRPWRSSSVSKAPREQLSLEQPGVGIGHGQAADPRRELLPGRHREDREAGVEPPRDHRPTVELRAEAGRDGDAPLPVDRMPVLAGEHRSPTPDVRWRRRTINRGTSRRFPTSHHFAPLLGILTPRGRPSMADFARIGGGDRTRCPGASVERDRGARSAEGQARRRAGPGTADACCVPSRPASLNEAR